MVKLSNNLMFLVIHNKIDYWLSNRCEFNQLNIQTLPASKKKYYSKGLFFRLLSQN